MYETWSVPKGGHEDNPLVIRLEYGYQPYKEEMHSRGSGSMKMNDEEIKKYTEAISKNSDNPFVCPRCKLHTDKLKANIKTHLTKEKPCMPSSSSSVVQNVQVTNDHSAHTINHDHSIHNTHNPTINNANITIQLEREREMVTRFSQPTSLITWLSARTSTILEHERIHSPSKLVSDIKEIKTIKDETENLHVVLLPKKGPHSVSYSLSIVRIKNGRI